MNLPGSSKGSGQSKKTSGTAGSSTAFKGAADLDLELKLMTAAALSASGYYCQINVNVSATDEAGLSDITDVDVLAIRHEISFVPKVLATSCKAGTKLSPAKEIFYLRGVLEYLHASEGVVLLANKPLAPHLKDLGRQLNVLALAGPEVDRWHKALSNGIASPGYFEQTRFAHVEAKLSRIPIELTQWLRVDFWFYQDFRNLSRVLGYVRRFATAFDGTADWHEAALYYIAGHLTLTVLDFCRIVSLLGVDSILETAPAYLFGGTASYKARKDLYLRVQQMLRETGMIAKGGSALPPLEPSYVPGLAELAIRFIDRPHAAIKVPQIFQDYLWRTSGATGIIAADATHLATKKLAQDVLDFLKAATGLRWVPNLFAPAAATVSP